MPMPPSHLDAPDGKANRVAAGLDVSLPPRPAGCPAAWQARIIALAPHPLPPTPAKRPQAAVFAAEFMFIDTSLARAAAAAFPTASNCI